MPVRGLTQWFSEEQAYTKREQLRLLVMELKEQLNPDLVYDPASDGCVIALSDQPESFDDGLPGLTPKPLPGGAQAMDTTPPPQQQQQQVSRSATPSGQQMASAQAAQKQVVVSSQQQGGPVPTQLHVANLATSGGQQLAVANQPMIGQAHVVSQQLGVAAMQVAVPVAQLCVAAPAQMTVAAAPTLQIASVTSNATQYFMQGAISQPLATSTPRAPANSRNAQAQRRPTPSPTTSGASNVLARVTSQNATRPKQQQQQQQSQNNAANRTALASAAGAPSTSMSSQQHRNASLSSSINQIITQKTQSSSSQEAMKNVVHSVVEKVLRDHPPTTSS